jgi:hypothetical protein
MASNMYNDVSFDHLEGNKALQPAQHSDGTWHACRRNSALATLFRPTGTESGPTFSRNMDYQDFAHVQLPLVSAQFFCFDLPKLLTP